MVLLGTARRHWMKTSTCFSTTSPKGRTNRSTPSSSPAARFGHQLRRLDLILFWNNSTSTSTIEPTKTNQYYQIGLCQDIGPRKTNKSQSNKKKRMESKGVWTNSFNFVVPISSTGWRAKWASKQKNLLAIVFDCWQWHKKIRAKHKNNRLSSGKSHKNQKVEG